MTLLVLSILVTLTWLIWAVGGALALLADKLENKCPKNAGFSFMPIIPLFPVIAILAANVVDKIATPWGTRTIGAIHIPLLLAFLIAIVRELFRLRTTNGPDV